MSLNSTKSDNVNKDGQDREADVSDTQDKCHLETGSDVITVIDVPLHEDLELQNKSSAYQMIRGLEPVVKDETSVLTVKQQCLHIVWPHRWEHDKNPDMFFEVLFKLHDAELKFHVSVLGQTYVDVPACFEEARTRLQGHILNWGFLSNKSSYYEVLQTADVVVSTAMHEFFGVSMLEATAHGCYPLCPRRLVYPEIFPDECLYNTKQQLIKRLRRFCQRPWLAAKERPQMDLSKYSWEVLRSHYLDLFKHSEASDHSNHC